MTGLTDEDRTTQPGAAEEDTGPVGFLATFKQRVAENIESGEAGGTQWWLNYTLAYVIGWTLVKTLPVWSLLLAWSFATAALFLAWGAVSPEVAMPDWLRVVLTVAVAVPIGIFRRPIIDGTFRAFFACSPVIDKVIEIVTVLLWFAFYIFLVWLFATKVLFAG